MATIRKREGKRGTRWQAIVRREGQNRTQSFRTKGEAEIWAKEMEVHIEKGNQLPSIEAKRRTVRELLERYKENEVPKKTDQRNPSRVADFWIKELGDLKLQHLTPAAIVEVRDELKKDRKGSTVNRYLALLSHACSIAEREWQWIESNPLRKVSKYSESQGRVRFLSDSERVALLNATSESDHAYLHAAVMVAITTGARKGEILGLKWADVDLSKGRAILHKTKNRDRRTLTLVPQAIGPLRELQQVRRLGIDDVFVDPPTGQPRHKKFESAWTKARKDAEITDFHFHDLRHTAASYLAMNGATSAEIAAVLGHRTLQMVKRYSHLGEEHTRDVVERTARKYLDE